MKKINFALSVDQVINFTSDDDKLVITVDEIQDGEVFLKIELSDTLFVNMDNLEKRTFFAKRSGGKRND